MLALFNVPLVTMRLVAEELRTGTFEVLIAHPVTDWQIVLAVTRRDVSGLLCDGSPDFSYLLILGSVGSPTGNSLQWLFFGLLLLGGMLLGDGPDDLGDHQSQVLAAWERGGRHSALAGGTPALIASADAGDGLHIWPFSNIFRLNRRG